MSQPVSILSTPVEKAFDFWVGEWEVSWTDKEGKKVTGSNVVTKILDGKVLQENFIDPLTGFKGTSISVFDTKDNTWKQSWADNSGGYFEFYGIVEDEIRIFQTNDKIVADKTIVMRMVFSDIKPDGFIWEWERSEDGGKTWQLQWKIDYKRIR